MFNKFSSFKSIDFLIIVRYIHFFIYHKNIAKKTFLWICDTIINPFYDGVVLHNNFLYNLKNNLNGLICLSDWHLTNLHSVYNLNLHNHQYRQNSDYYYY